MYSENKAHFLLRLPQVPARPCSFHEQAPHKLDRRFTQVCSDIIYVCVCYPNLLGPRPVFVNAGGVIEKQEKSNWRRPPGGVGEIELNKLRSTDSVTKRRKRSVRLTSTISVIILIIGNLW